MELFFEIIATTFFETLAMLWESRWWRKRDAHRERLAALKEERRERKARHE